MDCERENPLVASRCLANDLEPRRSETDDIHYRRAFVLLECGCSSSSVSTITADGDVGVL